MKRVAVVVGDTGLIGNAAAAHLNEVGYDVTGVSRRPYRAVWGHHASSNWIHDAEVRKALRSAAVIFFMDGLDGGSVFKRDHGNEILEYSARTVELAESVLAFARPRKMVLCSSTDVLKSSSHEPSSYVRGKMKIEGFAVECQDRAGDTEVLAVRIGNTFGVPDVTGIERGRLMPTWCEAALRGHELRIFGNPTQVIEFFWHADVAQSIVGMGTSCDVIGPIAHLPSSKGHSISLGSLRELVMDVSSTQLILETDFSSDATNAAEFRRKVASVMEWVRRYRNL